VTCGSGHAVRGGMWEWSGGMGGRSGRRSEAWCCVARPRVPHAGG
jgi:hypothetical protein